MTPMRVLSVASEIYPLIKTGGLADVAGALPVALRARRRRDAHAGPRLSGGDGRARGRARRMRDWPTLFGGPARLLAGTRGGLDLFVLDAPHLFDRPGNPYLGARRASTGRTTALRFAALARIAADIGLGAVAGFRPDIVHAHDWQAALAPAYLHYDGGRAAGTVITVHNLAFQGQFPPAIFGELRLAAARVRASTASNITAASASQGRPAVRRSHHHGVADLCAGDPDAGVRHGARRPAARRAPACCSGIVNGIDDRRLESGHRSALAAALSAPTHSTCACGQQGRAADAVRARRRARTRCCSASSAACPGRRASTCCWSALPTILGDGRQLALLGTGDAELQDRCQAPHAASGPDRGRDRL